MYVHLHIHAYNYTGVYIHHTHITTITTITIALFTKTILSVDAFMALRDICLVSESECVCPGC